MDAQQIRDILRDAFGASFEAKNIGGWVSMRCPLSPWTHAKGADNLPSAGVSINPNGCSIFNCFTCGHPMPLHAMLRSYSDHSGVDLSDLADEVEDEEYLGAKLPSWDSRVPHAENVLMELDSSLYMGVYESAAGHPYLRERGISDRTARRLELLFDPGEHMADKEPRILFPVRGIDGQLYGFSGRAIRTKALLKVRDYYGLPKAHCVLGAHLVGDQSTSLIAEGLFDYANGWECGYPTLAVMHSNITDAQAAVLRELGKTYYAFFDNDDAGQKGVKAAIKQLAPYTPVMRVTYPKIWIDEGGGRGHWLKDPGEMEPGEFAEMIAGGRLC